MKKMIKKISGIAALLAFCSFTIYVSADDAHYQFLTDDGQLNCCMHQ